jgi:hypothetical protein
MYKVHVGCKKWSDDNTADTMKEAREIIEAWKFAGFKQGDDKATEAWIDSETGNRFVFNIAKGEWEQ